MVELRARGGGFEPPSSSEHWMFADSNQERDSNPAPCRSGPSPLGFRIMPSAVLKVCWIKRWFENQSSTPRIANWEPERSPRSRAVAHTSRPNSTRDETLIYVARVEYSCSSACGALELCRMASSKRIYTASNLSGATQTAATAAMVGREALTRHYP